MRGTRCPMQLCDQFDKLKFVSKNLRFWWVLAQCQRARDFPNDVFSANGILGAFQILREDAIHSLESFQRLIKLSLALFAPSSVNYITLCVQFPFPQALIVIGENKETVYVRELDEFFSIETSRSQ